MNNLKLGLLSYNFLNQHLAMSKEDVRRPVTEKNSSFKEKDDLKLNYNLLSKHLKKVYPDRLYNESTSPLSLSSLSLSLSQNSSDSTDSCKHNYANTSSILHMDSIFAQEHKGTEVP